MVLPRFLLQLQLALGVCLISDGLSKDKKDVMRVFMVTASWLLAFAAFILATTGGFLIPGLMCVASFLIRLFLKRQGFSIVPNGSFIFLCTMWWSADRQFSTHATLLAARSGCVALFILITAWGVFRDIQNLIRLPPRPKDAAGRGIS